MTPLIAAAAENAHADCIGLLVKAGAELEAKDDVSRAAFGLSLLVDINDMFLVVILESAPLVLSVSFFVCLSLSFLKRGCQYLTPNICRIFDIRFDTIRVSNLSNLGIFVRIQIKFDQIEYR